jgi:glutamate-1-semialdehyde 2,1-aminomutase
MESDMSINRQQSDAAFNRAKNLFPGGVNSPVRAWKSVNAEPFVVERGQGPFLFDLDGNRYVDYIGSWGPLVLGHAHPQVLDAIRAQIEKGTSYGACCAQEAELGEAIMAAMPNIEMLRFVNSGTEAGMSVIRLARAFTSRTKIIKFAGCYHGHVDSLLVQAGSGVATLGLPDCAGVPQSFTGDTLTAPYNDLSAVRALYERFPDQIAAVIIEPVIGNAGFITPRPGYLEGLRELTRQYDSLLIFDEVMTGFRVHPGGAQALYNIKPDLSMLGKVIGGGLPVGAFGGRRDIMSLLAPLGPVYQAGTLSGNPLAMVAGRATLKLWLEEKCFDKAARSTEQLVAGLRESAQANGIEISAAAIGTMFGFFFQPGPVYSYEDAKRSNTERFTNFFHRMLANGVYIAPSQFEAGFVSSVHEGEALERTLEAFSACLQGL